MYSGSVQIQFNIWVQIQVAPFTTDCPCSFLVENFRRCFYFGNFFLIVFTACRMQEKLAQIKDNPFGFSRSIKQKFGILRDIWGNFYAYGNPDQMLNAMKKVTFRAFLVYIYQEKFQDIQSFCMNCTVQDVQNIFSCNLISFIFIMY